MQYWIVKSGTKEVISGPFETQDEANKEMARFPVGGDAKSVTQGNYLGNGLIEAVQSGMTFKIDWDGESIVHVEYVRNGKVGLIRLNRPKTASGQPIRPEDKIEMSIEEFEASAKPVKYNPVSKKFESIYDLEKAKEELQDALRDLKDAIAIGEDKEVIKELQDEVKHCREVLNSLSESASYEKDMDENKPVIIRGVKGMKSTPFTKKFKNMAAYEKWADSEAAENFEVQQVMNESAVFDFSTTNDADILKVSAALEKAGIPFEVEEKGESFVVKVLDSRDQLVASELIGDTMKESVSLSDLAVGQRDAVNLLNLIGDYQTPIPYKITIFGYNQTALNVVQTDGNGNELDESEVDFGDLERMVRYMATKDVRGEIDYASGAIVVLDFQSIEESSDFSEDSSNVVSQHEHRNKPATVFKKNDGFEVVFYRDGGLLSRDFYKTKEEAQSEAKAWVAGGMNESAPKVRTNKYSWGTMKVIEVGSDFSIPLHPENIEQLKNLGVGEVVNFVDETGTKWKVKKEDDMLQFFSTSGQTSVPQSKLIESEGRKIGIEHHSNGARLVSTYWDGKNLAKFLHPEQYNEVEEGGWAYSDGNEPNNAVNSIEDFIGLSLHLIQQGGGELYVNGNRAHAKNIEQTSGSPVNIRELQFESAQLSPFERAGLNPVYSEDGKKATIKIFSECEMEKFNKVVEAYLNTYIESIEYKIEESDDNCLCVIEVKLVQSPETKGNPEGMMKELKTESVLVENEIMDQVLNSIAVFLKSNSNLVVSDSHNSPRTYSENGVEFGYSYSSQTRPPIVTVSLLDNKLSLLGLLTEPPKFVMRANFSGLHSVSSLKSANLDRAKSSLIQQLQSEKIKSTGQIDQLLKVMQ